MASETPFWSFASAIENYFPHSVIEINVRDRADKPIGIRKILGRPKRVLVDYSWIERIA